MTPAQIISEAEKVGITLRAEGDVIKARGSRDVVQAIVAPLVKAHRAELLAYLRNDPAIPHDLEQMIRRAGCYYGYSPEDYDLLRASARQDPDGLRRALLSDPLQPYYDDPFTQAIPANNCNTTTDRSITP